MARIKIGELNSFLVLAATQAVFACVILANELLAINNRFPGGNYPFEIRYSWTRVLLFFGGAIISLLVVWAIKSKKLSFILLPSLKSVLALAIFPTLFGLFAVYLAFMGWCCEQPFGFFLGFPFSFVLGVAGFDHSILQYANYGLFEILTTSEFILNWKFLPYQFLLNFLFWSNIIFIFETLFFLVIQRGKFTPQITERTQSEIN
jgi:hypothetical protein